MRELGPDNLRQCGGAGPHKVCLAVCVGPDNLRAGPHKVLSYCMCGGTGPHYILAFVT